MSKNLANGTDGDQQIGEGAKVLLVCEYGALNGGENSLLAILSELINIGFRFEALVPPDSDLEREFSSLGVATHPFLPGSGPTRKSQEQIRNDIVETVSRIQPDILHANSLSTSRMVGPVAERTGVPAMGYLRDIIGLSKKAVSDINLLDQIIAVSAATRLHHLGQGMIAEKVAVIHNGVDLEKFHPEKVLDDQGVQDGQGEKETCWLRNEIGVSSQAQILLCIGQIGLRKGVDSLIESFQLLVEDPEVADVHLVIVGIRHSQKDEAIAHEERLHRMCEPFSDRVHWLGRRSDIAELMRSATLLVHAARQEPLGRVLLEASASGLPIVATNVGGTAEIIDPSIDKQLLCEPNDPRQMAANAKRVLNSPSLQADVSRRLRSSAESRFRFRRCAHDVADVYRELLRPEKPE